jgi:hypothetical protein
VSVDWLNGAGLVCNIIGVVAIFFFGVPRYPNAGEAGHVHFILEQEDADERKQVRRAVSLSRAGLVVLGVGFALQLAALIAY